MFVDVFVGFPYKALAKRVLYHSTLLNSTFMDGVGLRGQTNATCCSVQTRTVENRDLERIMIPNFRRNYPFCSCLRDDLLPVRDCSHVEERGPKEWNFVVYT